MSRAELVGFVVERFKSYAAPARVELAPLTVILGRNNSGKSSLIQALLLLKQTLAYKRADVPLHLEGAVDAISLRELTFGWPDTAVHVNGPRLALTLRSDVDVHRALGNEGRWPDLQNLAKHSGIPWLSSAPNRVRVETTVDVEFAEREGSIVVEKIVLSSTRVGDDSTPHPRASVFYNHEAHTHYVRWGNAAAGKLDVALDHFIPLLTIDKRNIGPRHSQRSFHYGYQVLYEQPLEDLSTLLSGLRYLGSTRSLPPSVYRPAVVPPEDVGASGEYAAQLLHARKLDMIHYLRPLELAEEGVTVSSVMQVSPVPEAVRDVMQDLGVRAPLHLEEIADVGFRLLFGNAHLQHVGRGLGYLLPVVLITLAADPLRFREPHVGLSLDDYRDMISPSHVAIEEPETHLHPKIQTHLAHMFVSMAMSGRRLILETHSDHLVRRLRGLIARATAGSQVEQWLAKNVVIVEVDQDDDGRSRVDCSHLTATGSIAERWPSDFMDEAADEERSIYAAGLEKEEGSGEYAADVEFVHDPGDS